MKKLFFMVVATLLLSTASIYGTEIFINGANVTGIKDQTIENCTVKIDGEGNIHINAPDVKIVTETEKPKNAYFLAVSVDSPLTSDFTISLNGRIIGKLDAGSKETLIELGDKVKKGENIISYLSEPSQNPVNYSILTGTGVKKGDTLEFTPVSTQKGAVHNLGAAGNFKFIAE